MIKFSINMKRLTYVITALSVLLQTTAAFNREQFDIDVLQLQTDFCPNVARPQNLIESRPEFTRYIYRGENFGNLLSRGFGSIGNNGLARYVLQTDREPDQEITINELLRSIIFTLVVVPIGVIILLIVLFSTCSVCSAKYRSCCSWLFCCRMACIDRPRSPTDEYPRKKRLTLIICSSIALGLYFFFWIVALGFSIFVGPSIDGATCQVARVLDEPMVGIRYDQVSTESNLLKPFDARMDFMGLDKTALEFAARAGAVMQSNVAFAGGLGTVNPHIDLLRTLKAASFVLAPGDFFTVHPITSLTPPSDVGATAVAENQSNLVGLYVEVMTAVAKLKVVLEETRFFMEDLMEETVADIKNQKGLVDWVRKYGYLFSLIGNCLLIVGILVAVVELCLLTGKTSHRSSPNSIKRAKRSFGFLFMWFGVSGALMIIFMAIMTAALSTIQGACSVIPEIIADPSKMLNHGMLASRLDGEPGIQFINECFADKGNGDLIKDAKSYVDFAGLPVLEASSNVLIESLDSIQMQEFFNNIQSFQGAVGVIANDDAARAVSFVFVETLLGGYVDETRIASSLIYTNAIQEARATQATDSLAYCYNTGMMDPQTTLYSIKSQLIRILTAWQSTNCREADAPVNICITSVTDIICANDLDDFLNLDSEALEFDFVGDNRSLTYDYSLGAICSSTHVCALPLANAITLGIKSLQELVSDSGTTASEFGKGIVDAFEEGIGGSSSVAQESFVDLRTTRGGFIQSVEKIVNVADPEFAACRKLAFAFGAVVEGACRGLQQPLVYIAVSWYLMGLLALIFTPILWQLFHYFRDLDGAFLPITETRSPSGVFAAAKTGDTNQITAFIKDGDTTLFQLRDQNENMSLHLAAYSGNTETMQQILRNVPVEAIQEQNAFGYTPLGVAATEGHAEIASMLIKAGADPTVLDYFGETALHTASRAGNLAVVKALCEDPAPEPIYLDATGEMPLDAAASQGNTEVQDYLSARTPTAASSRQ